jgi:hypothetical protein
MRSSTGLRTCQALAQVREGRHTENGNEAVFSIFQATRRSEGWSTWAGEGTPLHHRPEFGAVYMTSLAVQNAFGFNGLLQRMNLRV